MVFSRQRANNPAECTGIRGLTRAWVTVPRSNQEPLVVTDRDGKPQEDPWRCTASVCIVGVYCWEISLGLADPGICLSCWFVIGFSRGCLLYIISHSTYLFVLSTGYSILCLCISCLYLANDLPERLLWWCLYVVRRLYSPDWRDCPCVFFHCLFMLLRVCP